MPYIPQDDRDWLRKHPSAIAQDPRELNYRITEECLKYLDSTGIRYSSLNAVVGALECAKQELYRRLVGPYEDAKCQENGDVYQDLLGGDR